MDLAREGGQIQANGAVTDRVGCAPDHLAKGKGKPLAILWRLFEYDGCPAGGDALPAIRREKRATVAVGDTDDPIRAHGVSLQLQLLQGLNL